MIKIVDNNEVKRFGDIAKEWWDPRGKFRPLHQINPARIFYVREKIFAHIGKNHRTPKPLNGLRLLDVGCGGGLIAEPLARLGATVTGLDPSPETIEAARAHAAAQELDIEYIMGTTQDLLERSRRFDCVTALEVVEHVPDISAFLESCAGLLEPNGLLIVSTLNRTPKSYALGIIGAEYVLGWLPKGTHEWSRFITPEELRDKLLGVGMEPRDERGLSYDPIRGVWQLSGDLSVNYMASAIKPIA